MKRTVKKSVADEFEKAQLDLDTYIDWLEDTGRLTSEERMKLINLVSDCVFRGIDFGHNGENA